MLIDELQELFKTIWTGAPCADCKLRDQCELDLDLPEGAFEIPLAIQDRSFNLDGSLNYPAAWQPLRSIA